MSLCMRKNVRAKLCLNIKSIIRKIEEKYYSRNGKCKMSAAKVIYELELVLLQATNFVE